MTSSSRSDAPARPRAWVWRWAGVVLGVVLSVAGLAYALSGVDFAELKDRLLAADPLWLLLGFLAMLAGLVCRSLRWRVLMAPIARVGVIDVNAFSMIGQMLNALLPAKLGEVARTALVARKYGVSFGAVLSTVAADRLLDMVSLVLLTLFLPLSFPLPPEMAAAVMVTAGAALGGILVLAVVVRVESGPARFGALAARAAAWGLSLLRVRAAAERAQALAAKLVHFLDSFRAGVVYLANGRRLGVSIGYTLAAWVFVLLYAGCTLVAVRAAPQLPVSAPLVLTITTNISSAAPSTPGNWGLYEGFARAGFDLMGRGDLQEYALVYSILAHSTWYFSVIAMGFASLAYEGLTLGDVRRMAR